MTTYELLEPQGIEKHRYYTFYVSFHPLNPTWHAWMWLFATLMLMKGNHQIINLKILGIGGAIPKPTHLVGDIDLNDTKSVLLYIAPFHVPTRYGSKKLSISQTLCICKSTGGPRGHNDQEYILSLLSFVPCVGQCSTYCRYMQITKFAHTRSSDHATIKSTTIFIYNC